MKKLSYDEARDVEEICEDRIKIKLAVYTLYMTMFLTVFLIGVWLGREIYT